MGAAFSVYIRTLYPLLTGAWPQKNEPLFDGFGQTGSHISHD